MVSSITYTDYNLIYFYRFIGSLLYGLGHYRCGSSDMCIQQWAYRYWSTLYSHCCSPLEGTNIYLDCLYVLSILFLGSLGPDKLRQYSKDCLKGHDCSGKEREHSGAFLIYIKGSFL